jgi:DNA-binding MarR family transcriptional regulator
MTKSANDPLDTHYAWNRRGFLLWHATLRWQRTVAAVLKPYGLTHVQFTLLGSVWYLERQGLSPSQADLAQHAGTDPMMTSQVVRALARDGLIERVPDGADGRVMRVHTTRRGKRIAEQTVREMDRLEHAFFDEAGEADAVLEVLRHLAHRDEGGDVIAD